MLLGIPLKLGHMRAESTYLGDVTVMMSNISDIELVDIILKGYEMVMEHTLTRKRHGTCNLATDEASLYRTPSVDESTVRLRCFVSGSALTSRGMRTVTRLCGGSPFSPRNGLIGCYS